MWEFVNANPFPALLSLLFILLALAGLAAGVGGFIQNRFKAKDERKRLEQEQKLALAREDTRQLELKQRQVALEIRSAERQAGIADDKLTRLPELGEQLNIQPGDSQDPDPKE